MVHANMASEQKLPGLSRFQTLFETGGNEPRPLILRSTAHGHLLHPDGEREQGRGGRPGNYLPAAIDGGKGGKWLRRPRGAAWRSCRSWGGPSCRRRAAPLPRACPDSGELSGRSCARFRGEVGSGERGDDGEHEAVRRGKRGRETRHGRGRPLLPAEGGRALPRQQGAAAVCSFSGRCTVEWGAREWRRK